MMLRGLLNPGVRFLARCRLAGKFALVAAVFLFSLGWLTQEMVRAQNEIIDFTQQEQRGLGYLMDLRRVLQDALAPSLRPGASSLETLAASDGRLRADLQTGQHLQRIQELWNQAGAKGEADPHRALLDEILALNSQVGDTSNLILDPDLESYYTMDVVLLKLFQLQSLDHDAVRLAQQAVQAKALAPKDRTQLAVLAVQIQELLDGFRDDIRDTKAFNSPLVRSRLREPAAGFLKQQEGLLTLVQERVAGPSLAATAEEVDRTGRLAMDSGFQFYDLASPVLGDLLQTRIHQRNVVKYRDLAIAAGGLLLCLYLFLALYQFMNQSFGGMLQLASALEAGDLTQRLETSAQDEIGQVTRAFDHVTSHFRTTISLVSEVTGRIYIHGGTITSSMEQQASFATELSSSVVEIASTMEEFSSTATQIAQHSQGVAERADRTLEETRHGAAEVESLANKINNINQGIKNSLVEILDLGRKSTEINKVMEIINDIANQTKLIAFNAALEAASAGESGKRFGVVALEIRRLADSVVESTGEIEGRITEILDTINRLVMTSEKSSHIAEQGQEHAARTVASLTGILNAVEETTDAARQISLSTQQQQIASGQVVIALKEIEHGVKFSTDAISNTKDATAELAAFSHKLRDLVNSFKIEDTPT
jgi:methyl-accepting chemotaxis protein